MSFGVEMTAVGETVFDTNTSHPSNINKTLGRGPESGVRNRRS